MRSCALLLTLLGAGSCASVPAVPAPTRVELTLLAEPRSNGGAPLSLRVYQLAAPAAFDAAQFVPMFGGDRALLGADLVSRADVVIAPGQSKTVALSPVDRVTTIGVFGAFRDYETLLWRISVPVAAHATTAVTVVSGTAGLSLRTLPVRATSDRAEAVRSD